MQEHSKICLLARFSALLFLAGCAEGLIHSARFVDSRSGVQLEYTLKTAHVALAEYHRTLRVVFARSEATIPLEFDSGGYVRVNVHRLPDGRLLVFDSLAHHVIDPEKETVAGTNPPPDAAAAEYLGCFDWPHRGNFGFISAADGAETKPPIGTTP